MSLEGKENDAYEESPGDSPKSPHERKPGLDETNGEVENKKDIDGEKQPERATWSNGMEFLMSCIATSVGLGNIWRFPFTAYENGGGAFLIPYIIVLFLVGKPMYYMEMVLGQFGNKNNVNVWSGISPAMKGVGWGQVVGTVSIQSYYVSIMAMTLFYLIQSFFPVLPWSYCWEEWLEPCQPSVGQSASNQTGNLTSSAELYLINEVIKELPDIDNGIGFPDWRLTLCLLASWVAIFLTLIRGVKSSGKASYFLALFPYVIMFILLIRAATLPGAVNGIIFFIKPDWEQLYNPAVWYAAVTQVFFSLSVCGGAIVMFASYNNFSQNVYRDAMIVTTLDTLTSLLAGFTIFGILGNLAYEMGEEDVGNVVGGGGTSLAFISYPDAIAKFDTVPQLFGVLFFFMLFVLGLGSAVGLHSAVVTVFADRFPGLGFTTIAGIGCVLGFLVGLVYVTPGGQYILNLVDYYGGTFIRLAMGIGEVIGVVWIYGLENFCEDLEFMLGRKVSVFWRWCWGVVTPFIMISVFVYALFTIEALTYGGYIYPTSAYVSGACLLAFGALQVPVWAVIHMLQNRRETFKKTIVESFKAQPDWGPTVKENFDDWKAFKAEVKADKKKLGLSKMKHYWYSLNGTYRKNK